MTGFCCFRDCPCTLSVLLANPAWIAQQQRSHAHRPPTERVLAKTGLGGLSQVEFVEVESDQEYHDVARVALACGPRASCGEKAIRRSPCCYPCSSQ